MALLEARNLSVCVARNNGRFPAVKDVSFDIDSGEITGLAGESGCGKTLTALSITGLLPRTAEITGGTIRFNPDYPDLVPLSEAELCRIRGREISMIFQEARQSLNPLMRSGDQVAEALVLHGLADKKTARLAARDMLAKLGLPEKTARSFPHQLSGGMCQRVMIAAAAVCRPRLLVADEPSAALDRANREQIQALLAGINRDSGTAILFISHDLSLLRRFCRRLLVMYSGAIVEQGPAEAVFAAPAHPYTRGLIGAIPGGEQRGRALASIPGQAPSIEDRLPGCPFAPRCPRRHEQCAAAVPPETDIGGGRRLRCFFPPAPEAAGA
jgi:peptide/nickel transport system ATP-binding protein